MDKDENFILEEEIYKDTYLLIEKYKSGDMDAGTKLIKNYQKLISKLAHKYYLKGGEFEDLQQVASMAFINCTKHFDKKRNANFGSYATMCIDCKLKTEIRASLSKKNIALNDSSDIDCYFYGLETGYIDCSDCSYYISNDPCDIIVINETLEESSYIIEKTLTKKEKEVWGYYTAGYSYKEISEELDCTLKSIDNSIQRAKGKLDKFHNKLLN